MIKVDLAGLDLGRYRCRNGVGINLESHAERGFRTDARANAAVLFTGNGLVQMERIAPESFIPKSVIAEGFLSFLQHLLRIGLNNLVKGGRRRRGLGSFLG